MFKVLRLLVRDLRLSFLLDFLRGFVRIYLGICCLFLTVVLIKFLVNGVCLVWTVLGVLGGELGIGEIGDCCGS